MQSLGALAEPTRRRIVEMLADGPLCAGDIAGRFEASAPAISQHLKALREAGLVRVRIDAQRRIYELDPGGVEALSLWVAKLRGFWEPRLGALQDQLEANRKDRSERT